MKKSLKLFVIAIFTLAGLGLFLNPTYSKITTLVSAQTETKPTPPAETPAPTVSPTPKTETTPEVAKSPKAEKSTETTITPTDAKVSDKKIPKEFTLGQDSFSEYGEVAFNHDLHAFQKYSPDGTSVVGCVECHHTDQPKSALKLPLLTSEREIALTMETWQKSDQKVTQCRSCHFQDGEVPDDKEMPTATYKDGDKETVKELNNENAYHINCNTCHDASAKLRPELKKKKGFATTNDCMICHLEN